MSWHFTYKMNTDIAQTCDVWDNSKTNQTEMPQSVPDCTKSLMAVFAQHSPLQMHFYDGNPYKNSFGPTTFPKDL